MARFCVRPKDKSSLSANLDLSLLLLDLLTKLFQDNSSTNQCKAFGASIAAVADTCGTRGVIDHAIARPAIAHVTPGKSTDGAGTVARSYSVALPDGRTQNVNYHANGLLHILFLLLS